MILWSRSPGTVTGLALLGTLALVAVCAHWMAPHDPFAVTGPALAPPSREHPFGTDDLGRDVFAGVVHGAGISLRVGLSAAACATLIGLVIGGVAGARTGVIDHGLMRATEFVQAIPRFFLVVLVVSLFDGHLWLIVLVIALTAWPATARVFRAQVLSTLGRDFVLAARAAGSHDSGILIRHVLPVTIAVVAAQVSYQAGGAILAEAGLSFLGLGDPTVMSWGTLLGAAHHSVREAWWIAVFPGLAITATVLACNLLADGLLRGADD
ncbi:MAG: ABC transporter permease [Acidobacteria bacterium]|nr:ABC transporter permease [Acidobacteriota bacterium]